MAITSTRAVGAFPDRLPRETQVSNSQVLALCRSTICHQISARTSGVKFRNLANACTRRNWERRRKMLCKKSGMSGMSLTSRLLFVRSCKWKQKMTGKSLIERYSSRPKQSWNKKTSRKRYSRIRCFRPRKCVSKWYWTPKISATTTKSSSSWMRETRWLNYRQTLKESARLKFRRRRRSGQLLKRWSKRTRWRKQSVMSRSRLTGGKTLRRLRPTFNIRFQLKRKGSRRSRTGVRGSPK